jgi:serine protease Do
LAGRTDPELKDLLDKYVCVRLVQMGGVDLATFQADPHLSWSVFLMNGDKTIYGRYGRASPQAKRDKADSNPNHTLAGLKAALRKGLEIHAARAADPKAWAPRLAPKTGQPPLWRFAEKTPAARKYKRLKRVRGKDTKGCVHCHEVHRVEIDSRIMKKKKLPDSLLWLYPDPSALGLTLSKDHCARVTRVEPASPAAEAGLKDGDELLSLNGQPLCSIADITWVLHEFPDDGGEIKVAFERGGEGSEATLTLEAGWRRKGDFCWRYRTFGYAMWLWAGVTLEDHEYGVRVAQKSPGWFKKPNRDARRTLREDDVIKTVDGKGGWTRSTLMAYLMREKRNGSTVKLEVIRRGDIVKLDFKLPKDQPEVQGY